MATQINLKFQDDFYSMTKEFSKSRGYMSVQEMIREAIREKIFDSLEIQEEYKNTLESKEVQTFLSEKESEDFHAKLKKKAGM